MSLDADHIKRLLGGMSFENTMLYHQRRYAANWPDYKPPTPLKEPRSIRKSIGYNADVLHYQRSVL